MNMPSLGYMDAISSGLSVAPLGGANPDPFGLGIGGPPVALNAPAPAPMGPPPPPPPPPDPHLDEARRMSVAPAAPVATPDPRQPPPPEPEPDIRMVSRGGVVSTPAREIDMRGPTLRSAQDEANALTGLAIQNRTFRDQGDIAAEQDMYRRHADEARARQAVADQEAAARKQELEQRTQDIDSSAKALSQMRMDPDRFWASRTTGQKIMSTISLALGGFVQGMRGGSNVGLDMLNAQIDRDIKAQEFAYNATRDTVQAKQTAFSMAMQKYGSVDAARSVARAAALDAVAADVGQMAAMHKGTDAANHADEMLVGLARMREQQTKQGVAFLPPSTQYVGPQYTIRGRVGTFTGPQVNAYRAEQEKFDRDIYRDTHKAALEGALEGVKGAAKRNEKIDEGVKGISTQLQTAGVPQARAAAELAMAALNKSPGGAGDAAARWALGDGTVANSVMPEDSNAREQAYQNFVNQSLKALMGNVTADEWGRAQKMLGSASDPASRRRAITHVLTSLDNVEKNAKAGASPEAQREYDRRRINAEGPALAPSGARPR